MRRIKLRFADNIEVDFVDRELGLKRVEEWAGRGTRLVQVIYGPEGCGKTAWLKQSAELLRELGFDVIYVNPVERILQAEIGVKDVKNRLLEIVRGATEDAWGRVAWAVIDAAREMIKAGRKRLAILADDVFQAIGLDRASIYVKGLLGLIEYPPADYERIVTIVATSEGISRREIGRHRWANSLPMWNMTIEGFRELYNQLPGDKPGFEEIWRFSGGNPAVLANLMTSGWVFDRVVDWLIREKRVKGFISSLAEYERELLAKAVEDPDVLMSREGIGLMDKLVELNLIVDVIPKRDPWSWIDAPPPERDMELGIGVDVAWQTPLHREAVRRSLEFYGGKP
ncbi:MAG: ATP-binding protein [Sulfolobales archaeon]